MPLTETVATDLQTITTGLGRAQTITTGLDKEAERITAQAAGAGFTAIAAAMSQIRTAIGELHARLHAATDAVRDTAASVDHARNEASPHEVITALSPAVDRTDTAHREITAALGKADDTQRLVSQALRGGNPGPMLSLLNELKQTLAGERQHLEQARHHLTEAIAQARQLGESGK